MGSRRICVSRAGNSRSGASDPADRSFLYGDAVLLCQKLGAAAQLVSWHEAVQKPSGELCRSEGYDDEDEAVHRGYGDSRNGDRVPGDEKCSCGTDLSGGGVGMPSPVFLFPRQNIGAG